MDPEALGPARWASNRTWHLSWSSICLPSLMLQLRENTFTTLEPQGAYIQDYHILRTTRDDGLIHAIRAAMDAAGVPIESSKGEWGPVSTRSIYATRRRAGRGRRHHRQLLLAACNGSVREVAAVDTRSPGQPEMGALLGACPRRPRSRPASATAGHFEHWDPASADSQCHTRGLASIAVQFLGQKSKKATCGPSSPSPWRNHGKRGFLHRVRPSLVKSGR